MSKGCYIFFIYYLKYPSHAAGTIWHKEAQPSCQKCEEWSLQYFNFCSLKNLTIKCTWVFGDRVFKLLPCWDFTWNASHNDFASEGRIYCTCFPITRVGLFLWHRFTENTPNWPLVMTETLCGVSLWAVWESCQVSNMHCILRGRFTFCALQRFLVCPVSSGWLKTLLTQQKHRQR